MKPVSFAPAAISELEDIWYFIAQDNPQRATSFVQEVREFCLTTLGSTPGIGVARPVLHPEIRMAPYRQYLVFYRETDTHVEIALITHGSRDQWISRFFVEE